VGKPEEPKTLPESRVAETIVAGEILVPAGGATLSPTLGPTDITLRVSEVAALPTGAGRYVQVRELGRGGMGKVDAVYDRALGRVVAKKTATTESALLVAEAQTCAQLEHPSIVPVYDVGSDGEGNPHYTMRVVKGRTLRAVLDERQAGGGPGLAQLLGIVRQVCLAVDYAHSRGVVHRDLKPDNVIVGEFGEVYVLDWGVAHVSEGSDVHRSEGGAGEFDLAGSPGYMAPEQFEGKPIDARTDVFALGVVVYEILCGELPYGPRDLWNLGTNPPPPLVSASARNAGVPKVLDTICAACLAIEPRQRPATTRWIAEEIDAFLDGERARAERRKEADELAEEGEKARGEWVVLSREAKRLREEYEEAFSRIPAWESAERKKDAWDLADRAKLLSAEAARALARAEAAFVRAIGRVAEHVAARRGLAALAFQQFEEAEQAGDSVRMTRLLDLARAHDDGTLAAPLADEGELVVSTDPTGLPVTITQYEAHGPLLVLGTTRVLGPSPTRPVTLPSGSYLVSVHAPEGDVRYPLLLHRATSHRLHLRIPRAGDVPEGFVFVPSGPFLARPDGRGDRLTETHLDGFAIGRFPVTLGEYCRFLDSLDEPERSNRTPRSLSMDGRTSALVERVGPSEWRPEPDMIEGPGRVRIAKGRELDVPVFGLSWYDAARYARWRAASLGKPIRLPTDMEWEKAARGADGRPFPMGHGLDPSFAKLRDSRPEASQPEPVGAFPLDESPFGVRDLTGGVGDLTGTQAGADALPELEDEGRVDMDARTVVRRGGNWASFSTLPRSLRFFGPVRDRTSFVGLRLAMSVPDGPTALLRVR